MKCEIVEIKKEKEFDPFELRIKVETKGDLAELWLRLNLEIEKVGDLQIRNKDLVDLVEDDGDCTEIWDYLNKKLGR